MATFNRARPLERLLTALERQTLPRDSWELWVAVDGSTDDTLAVLERWQAKGTLPLQFLHQQNAGQSAARHAAILRSHGAHTIVIDDDMEVCPDFVAAHLEASRQNPGKTVVIGKVVPETRWFEKPLYAAVGEHALKELHARLESGAQAVTATAFVTQNVSFPRALYLELGGFDVALRLDEDRELGMRLERAGATFVFAPAAWAIHHSNVGAYATWYKRQHAYGDYAVGVWEKHGRDPYLHPLRNFVAGSRLNRLVVQLLVPVGAAPLGCAVLRGLGALLQKLGAHGAAIATHKAILSLQYHRGVRDRLGSWSALRAMEATYRAHPGRPLEPTGRGRTMQ